MESGGIDLGNMGLPERLILEMTAFDGGDPKRIQHFIKVYCFARLIGLGEGLDEHTQLVLECAAVLHDIGIHPAEEKYSSSGGKLQEKEGPIYARPMLEGLAGAWETGTAGIMYGAGKVSNAREPETAGRANGTTKFDKTGFDKTGNVKGDGKPWPLSKADIDRICYLIGHHHTYDGIDGIDYQILVEADFLVNIYEDGMDEAAVKQVLESIFRTGTGKDICRRMFGIG